MKVVFSEAFELTDAGWRALTLRFGLFFVALAIANEIVWRNFSDDGWTNYKVFGVLPVTLLFMVLQMPLLQRHGIRSESEADTE